MQKGIVMKKIVFCIVFTALMLLPILQAASIASNGHSNESDRPVIGVILPFSPAFADIAQEQKNAIEMALFETGNNVDIIFKAEQGDPASAIRAFNELAGTTRRPVAIITASSWSSNAIHPLAAKEDIFHIAIASAILNRSHPNHTVRLTLDGKIEEQQLAKYLSQFNRIAVFNMDNDYGNNWARIINDTFKDKIVASIAYDPQGSDFGPQLAVIKKENPDAMVLLSARNASRIAKQAREMGITAQFVGTRPIERPDLLNEPAIDGLVYTYPSHSFKHHMIGEYEKRHGTPPTFFGIEAYDAFSTLIGALKAKTNSPETLFAQYAGSSWTGALGEFRFDENGDAAYPYMYKQVTNGKFEVADFPGIRF